MKLNHYVVNYIHCKNVIHKEVCSSFRSNYTELFKHTLMRKYNISFKIRNHFSAILPNHIYSTNLGMAVKLPSGVSGIPLKLRQHKERAIIVALSAICTGINMCGVFIIKAAIIMARWKNIKSNDLCYLTIYTKLISFSQQTKGSWKHNSGSGQKQLSKTCKLWKNDIMTMKRTWIY